jgi:hypothetical protein
MLSKAQELFNKSHGNSMSSKQEVSYRMNVGEDDKSESSDLQVDRLCSK